ncbi:conserved hypothetical protein [Pseudomonas sp. 8Z]|uniref:hypothetical protein n=1 Tax=Pseudomonas sp. 8Z TaxID=2653166 RepID=UPI0012EF4EF5|nr:hypothetical protein [Pseudomonas sp. 8Z]VXC25342.1 conserved hypothetical protein [Pseudomonas sp. 8Z]
MISSHSVEPTVALASESDTAACAIQAVPVERDQHGFWTHPQYPQFWDEGTTSSEINAWLSANGLQSQVTEYEYDAPDELQAIWMETGTPACCRWQPTEPSGSGWFIFSLHDTERGPVCVWVRQKPLSDEKEAR